MYAVEVEQPKRKHRTTIYRAAQRLSRQAEGCSAGVYWTAEQVAAWHPQDLDALAERVGREGVGAMTVRADMRDILGAICWSCDP